MWGKSGKILLGISPGLTRNSTSGTRDRRSTMLAAPPQLGLKGWANKRLTDCLLFQRWRESFGRKWQKRASKHLRSEPPSPLEPPVFEFTSWFSSHVTIPLRPSRLWDETDSLDCCLLVFSFFSHTRLATITSIQDQQQSLIQKSVHMGQLCVRPAFN